MSDDLGKLEYYSKTAQKILEYASEEHLQEAENWKTYEKYMGDGRFTRQRNLRQNKLMTEKEFIIFVIMKQIMKDQEEVVVVDDALSGMDALDYEVATETYEEFQFRVTSKIDELHEDYEISDLKANDRFTLEELAKALVTLENLDLQLFDLRKSPIKNLTAIKDLSNIVNQMRTGISRMQDTLGISRKVRKDLGAETAREELNRQKELAKKMLTEKLAYVYCDKCTMLLSTTWFLFDGKENTLSLTCGREYFNEETAEVTHTCDHVTTVTSTQLLEQGGTNHHEGFKF